MKWKPDREPSLLLWLSQTRRLVNVRLQMMFRPELIYIFDLIKWRDNQKYMFELKKSLHTQTTN